MAAERNYTLFVVPIMKVFVTKGKKVFSDGIGAVTNVLTLSIQMCHSGLINRICTHLYSNGTRGGKTAGFFYFSCLFPSLPVDSVFVLFMFFHDIEARLCALALVR